MRNKVRRGLATAVVASVAVLGLAVPAGAASGTITCWGAREAAVVINAKSSGAGTWTNQANAGQSSSFSFPGGASTKFSPYQKAYWAATASGGFYSNPYGVCL